MKLDTGVRAAMLLAVLSLQACGGAETQDGKNTSDAPTAARPQAARGQPDALFASDGRPSAAARQPPGGWQYRTRAGLYATPAQVAWEALTVEPYTVLVDVDRHANADAAVERTLADFRWSGEIAGTAFYVQAADAARAVEVADELHASGVPHVFLVVGGAR